MPTYFEDITVGDVATYGSYRVTESEIIDFAEQFDPQLIHTDPDTAAETDYGGLIASGWHTAAMSMRLIVDGFLMDAATMGSPGVDELRWPAPVRPGHELSVRTEILDKQPSETNPARGTAVVSIEATTQDHTTVLSMTAKVLFARREE